MSWDAKGSGSESEESTAGSEKAEEPEAREVVLVVDELDLRTLAEDAFLLVVFLTEADGRGGLNGFGGIFAVV